MGNKACAMCNSKESRELSAGVAKVSTKTKLEQDREQQVDLTDAVA